MSHTVCYLCQRSCSCCDEPIERNRQNLTFARCIIHRTCGSWRCNKKIMSQVIFTQFFIFLSTPGDPRNRTGFLYRDLQMWVKGETMCCRWCSTGKQTKSSKQTFFLRICCSGIFIHSFSKLKAFWNYLILLYWNMRETPAGRCMHPSNGETRHIERIYQNLLTANIGNCNIHNIHIRTFCLT